MRKILFVDDDRFYAMHWIERLKDRFEVTHYIDAQQALQAIVSSTEIDCLIVDVMMPTPDSVPAEATSGGLTTGVWLLRQISEWISANSIPVIVITNREPDTIRSAVDSLGLPEGLVDVRRKLDTNRSRLLELVSDMIALWGRP